MSFSIKKSFGSRKGKIKKIDNLIFDFNLIFVPGWKIMPDDGEQSIDGSALKSVVSIIKDMEMKVYLDFGEEKIVRNFRDLPCLRGSASKFLDMDIFWKFLLMLELFYLLNSTEIFFHFFLYLPTFNKQIKCTES